MHTGPSAKEAGRAGLFFDNQDVPQKKATIAPT